ncbi:unnamed protein product [Microthlaspi erraticum]|uniref:Uncharacterized protein n=1 Tax=Microthlaspi erraticum TaxID=1685480 RepID=A0A6D2KC06_9BRAS|nr:unnamed protein product [Microthlaspi erraticum]
MDFIKTSSLRALIELTFQRNWNGFIWMSRKGVTTKRVKTVQTALSRTAPNRAVRLAEERCFTLGQISSVRLKSRPKSKTVGRSRITTRETKPAVGHATTATPHAAHDHAARAGNKASRPRNRSYHGRCTVRAGKHVPRPAERFHRPSLHPSDHSRPTKSVRPRPFRLRPMTRSVRPIVPTDRPNAAVDPKPVLKPVSYFQGPA